MLMLWGLPIYVSQRQCYDRWGRPFTSRSIVNEAVIPFFRHGPFRFPANDNGIEAA